MVIIAAGKGVRIRWWAFIDGFRREEAAGVVHLDSWES
jgi:hypothetical protein